MYGLRLYLFIVRKLMDRCYLIEENCMIVLERAVSLLSNLLITSLLLWNRIGISLDLHCRNTFCVLFLCSFDKIFLILLRNLLHCLKTFEKMFSCLKSHFMFVSLIMYLYKQIMSTNFLFKFQIKIFLIFMIIILVNHILFVNFHQHIDFVIQLSAC